MASREEWIGRTGQEWAARGTALDRLLGPPAAEAVRVLAPRPGQRVLDLGCGAGASTEALADLVGPEGKVLGIDISPDLIAQAAVRLARVPNAEAIEADAAKFAPAGTPFEALYSRFGSMFFDDPAQAFGHLHGLLVPGAPAVFAAWQGPKLNAWASVPLAFRHPQLEEKKPSRGAPGPFAWADPVVFQSQLSAGGFGEIQHRPLLFAAEISEGNDQDPVVRAVEFMMRIGPLAARLRGAEAAVKAAARAYLAEALSDHLTNGAVRLDAAAWIITARA